MSRTIKKKGASPGLRCVRDLILILVLSLLMGSVIAWAAEEKQPVQLVEINPIGGSYISTTPEFTLTFDKNVANAEVREHNKGQILFQDNSGNEIMIRVSIADDEIYPNQKREIQVRVLEALSPGNYRLIVKAGIRAKNGTETRKSSTYYYRVKAAAPPVEPSEPETESGEEITEAPTEKETEASEPSTEEQAQEPEESMEETGFVDNPSLGDSDEDGKEPSGDAAGPGREDETKDNSSREEGKDSDQPAKKPAKKEHTDREPEQENDENIPETTTVNELEEKETQAEDAVTKETEEKEASDEDDPSILDSLNMKGVGSQTVESEGNPSLILYSIELTDRVGEEEELSPYVMGAEDGEGSSPAPSGGSWPTAAIGGFLISSLGCVWRVLKFYRDIR